MSKERYSAFTPPAMHSGDKSVKRDSHERRPRLEKHRHSGVIHIECRKRAGKPSEYYLLSFGGGKDGVGAFYLAKAMGSDPLTALLRKLGAPGPAIETALQVLVAEPHHKIPNVTLTQAQMRELRR